MSKRSRRPWKPSAKFSKSMHTARERSPSGINPLGKDGRRLKREGARVDLIILLRAGYRGKHLQSNWLIHDDVAKLHLQEQGRRLPRLGRAPPFDAEGEARGGID